MPDRPAASARRARAALAACACLSAITFCRAAESGSDGFLLAETDADRWIQLESQIAAAENAWKTEEATLRGSIKLLETEQATLQRNLEANRMASDRIASNRNRVAAAVAERYAAFEALEEPLQRAEQRLRRMYPNLPEPLRRQIDASLGKLALNDDGAKPSLATRAQALVSALASIERFSNAITLSRESRPGPAGGEVSARVLYWGLAIGYAIDEANGRAWTVEPNERGWEWIERPEAFDGIAILMASYDREDKDPQLVLLPAAIR